MRNCNCSGGLAGLFDTWDWSTQNVTDPMISEQYVSTFDIIAPGIVDYANSIKTVGMSLIDAVSQARTSLAMSDYQRQLLQVQIDRAKQGLPPTGAVTDPHSIPTETDWLKIAAIGVGIFALLKGK